MAFLRRQGKFAHAPFPDLILLDLYLPRKDGRAVLAEVKADPDLTRIPVFILTTSQEEQNVFHAHEVCANCYISKPVDLKQFISTVESIDGFCLTVVKLPPNGPS